ncbi:hypothetical protein AQUSIP_06910 [Aquicella siphonis]|uniref:FAD-dependent urate hydroxylase HpyO/Asp monooxygenase CreE-like FAD/NAD(P)-binding domain-containing protein n=1 Tax=Aquicella siphonis TaxID=254247 RepID=A0A5E4PGG7_9COXI|nr:FAD/NAD(P)-binding protein [Aquicella siphonis]VVC75401.1 hypothetical protein AQUSIP_06910 [Aquicella siphonis]
MFSQHNNNHSDNIIAIVGSGLSGIAAFCQMVDKLIETSTETHKILLFEKEKEQFATGVPYTTDSPSIWTLNNPAAKLKLMANGITMADWMNIAREKWEPSFHGISEEYPPRALVGLFLKDQYTSYKSKALAHGIVIEEYIEEVIDLERDHDKWNLITNCQRHFSINTLFLCLGHAPNNQFSHLKESRNFFPAGTRVDDLKRIPKDVDVYIIGGQATFVDIALWLAYDNHHAGRIHVITRNPPIITTKGNNDACDASSIHGLTNILKTRYKKNTLRLSEAESLFWNAYSVAAKKPVDLSKLPRPQTALSYQIKKYKKDPLSDDSIGNVDELRSFIFNFYFSGCYAEFWDKLKDEDKADFNQRLYSFIFAYLTGITPLNAQLLLELYDRDLIVEENGLTSVRYDSNKKRFILKFSNDDEEEAEYLIDSSGLGYDISKQNANFSLLSNLVTKGYLVPARFGGIQLNDYGQAFNGENELQSNLICIGPAASYCHPVPTPYASFIAIDAVQKALSALTFNTTSFQLKAL